MPLATAVRNPVGMHPKVGSWLASPFAELLAHPATAGVPLVLETPGSRDPGDPQLPLLKELRDTAGGAAS